MLNVPVVRAPVLKAESEVLALDILVRLPSESLSNNSELVLTPSPLKRSSITVFGAGAPTPVPVPAAAPAAAVERVGVSCLVEAAG